MTNAEVWVRTDTTIIRADTIRAVGWKPPVAGLLLEVAISGAKKPLTIQVQPDLPYPYRHWVWLFWSDLGGFRCPGM